MSLESQLSTTPPVAPQQPQSPAPATPQPPIAAEDVGAEPDGTVVQGAQRLVPLSVLIDERKARQSAQRERSAAEVRAAQYEKAAQDYEVVKPYLPLLATHPKVTGKPEAAAPQNTPDPELVEIAETFGFYDNNGELDLKRAKGAQGYISKRTQSEVEQVVRPVARTAAESQAGALRQRAYELTDKSGRPMASREHIDAVLSQLDPEQASKPEVVQLAVLIARGLGGAPAGEPLHTENAGGPGGQPGKSLSNMERAAAKARGLTDEQWTKQRDNDSLVLE